MLDPGQMPSIKGVTRFVYIIVFTFTRCPLMR